MGEKSLTNARHNQPVGCVNSGAVSHCRLIFERLVYTRLVLKKFISRGDTRTQSGGGGRGKGGGDGQSGMGEEEGGDENSGTASIRLQMLSAKFKVPLSPTNERGQLNIGLTKNTTTLVCHSRSCHSLSPRIIRYIKLYLTGYTRRRRRRRVVSPRVVNRSLGARENDIILFPSFSFSLSPRLVSKNILRHTTRCSVRYWSDRFMQRVYSSMRNGSAQKSRPEYTIFFLRKFRNIHYTFVRKSWEC